MARWRTIQFFLYHFGVCEVQIDTDQIEGVKCTCPQFTSKKRCNHAKWVTMRINVNGGHYPLQLVTKNLDENVILTAMKDTERFRELVLKNTRIEVID